MLYEFSLDLKVARRKSGLTQEDCAHLLDVNKTLISRIENGKRIPTVREICTLSLIYGKSFESLFSGIIADAQESLRERVITIPDAPYSWIGSLNRKRTLDSLARRLREAERLEHEG